MEYKSPVDLDFDAHYNRCKTIRGRNLIMPEVTVSSKGQIALPKEVRKVFGLKERDSANHNFFLNGAMRTEKRH